MNQKKLQFKNFELRLDETSFTLDAPGKQKRHVQLYLAKVYENSAISDQEVLDLVNQTNARLVIQVKPNGPSHEIPVRVSYVSLKEEKTLEAKKSTLVRNPSKTVNDENLKIATSKSIVHFGQCLHKSASDIDGLEDEFTIKNLNNFDIKGQISLNNLDPKASVCFKFTKEMLENKSLKINDKMNDLQFGLSKLQEMKIRIRFDCSDEAGGAATRKAVAKIKANGFAKAFNVKLVGFNFKNSLLNFQNLIKINEIQKVGSNNRFVFNKREHYLFLKNQYFI